MANPSDADHSGDFQRGVAVKSRPKVARPPMFRVIFYNDDYTTCEFVVFVLRRYFYKSEPEAEQLMRSIHRSGSGVAGVYPRDVAETKKRQVEQLARSEGMPLRLSIEPDSVGSEGD